MKIYITNIGQHPTPYVKNTEDDASLSLYERGENTPGMIAPGEFLAGSSFKADISDGLKLETSVQVEKSRWSGKKSTATVTYTLIPSPDLKIEIR